MKKYCILCLQIILIFSGCNKVPPKFSKIGVFADSSSLFEISLYAIQRPGYSSNVYWIKEKPGEFETIPVIKSIKAFYVNIPNANISESKIIWIKEGFNRKLIEDGWEVFRTEIEKVDEDVYKISSAQLKFKSRGLIGIKLSMPLGVPDRIYLVQFIADILAKQKELKEEINMYSDTVKEMKSMVEKIEVFIKKNGYPPWRIVSKETGGSANLIVTQTKDAWGNNWHYRKRSEPPVKYWLGSSGSDGIWKGWKKGFGWYSSDSPNGFDIVFENNKMIWGPKYKNN